MPSPAFIWDLDGTLFDSYAIIVSAVCQTLEEYGITADAPSVLQEITATSVTDFIQRIAKQHNCDGYTMFRRSCYLQTSQDDSIRLNPHAKTTLEQLHTRGAKHFVYTHKGDTAQAVLDRLGIGALFTEVITAAHGFARKPDPEGVDYLVHKHGLDKQRCYYVGDRIIDLQCAANAQIQSILYLYSQSSHEAKGLATYCVSDLQQILDIQV